MHISSNGLKLIEEFEGGRSADGLFHAYLDTVAEPHIWTIGFGQTKNVHQGMTWTLQQALGDLSHTLATDGYEAAINSLGVKLNPNQFDALCSFVYNLGPGSMQWDVGRSIRAKNFRAAADEMLKYDHAGGVQVAGLTRRRQTERALFLTPWVEPDPHHYDWFILRERSAVEEYDRLRAMQTETKHPHRARLAVLRVQLAFLVLRLKHLGHSDQFHRGWRIAQMNARAKGQSVVR